MFGRQGKAQGVTMDRNRKGVRKERKWEVVGRKKGAKQF